MRILLLGSLLLGCGNERGGRLQSDSSDTDAGEFPCEVREVIQSHCARCHASERTFIGTTPALETNNDWHALREGEPFFERAKVRLLDEELPMPPNEILRQQDLEILLNWLDREAPTGSCPELTPIDM